MLFLYYSMFTEAQLQEDGNQKQISHLRFVNEEGQFWKESPLGLTHQHKNTQKQESGKEVLPLKLASRNYCNVTNFGRSLQPDQVQVRTDEHQRNKQPVFLRTVKKMPFSEGKTLGTETEPFPQKLSMKQTSKEHT